jgi:hypothetical protein
MRQLTRAKALEQARLILKDIYDENRGMSQEELLSRHLLVTYERGRLDGAFPGRRMGMSESDPSSSLRTLREWAVKERDYWDERNADRFWQMSRVVHQIDAALLSPVEGAVIVHAQGRPLHRVDCGCEVQKGRLTPCAAPAIMGANRKHVAGGNSGLPCGGLRLPYWRPPFMEPP